MLNPRANITELMRVPIMGVDDRSLVHNVLALAEENNVHFFAVQQRGKLMGRICACDLRDARPDSPVSDYSHPLLVTLSADTSLQESLAAMRPGMDWTVVRDKTTIIGVVTWHDVRKAVRADYGENDDYKCSSCDHDHRLRVAQNDLLLCLDCCDRAIADDWYDLGAAG